MSINRNYYVIAGYDLTPYKTDKYDDWRWTKEGEQYTCHQSKGKIQLFNDPMGGSYLYLGYILAAGDEYDFKTEKFGISLTNLVTTSVTAKLIDLHSLGIITKEAIAKCRYEVIVFEECT